MLLLQNPINVRLIFDLSLCSKTFFIVDSVVRLSMVHLEIKISSTHSTWCSYIVTFVYINIIQQYSVYIIKNISRMY